MEIIPNRPRQAQGGKYAKGPKMSQKFNQQFTIVISAPRGALGRPLATLLHHVCNALETPLDIELPTPGQIQFNNAERMAYRDQDISVLQRMSAVASAGTPQVITSRLSLQTLNSVFSDAVFISISAQDSSKSQLGYNLLREELAQDRTIQILEPDMSAVEQLMFKQSFDWAEEMRDPLHMDKTHVQLLSMYLGKMRTNVDSIRENDISPDADKVLELTYEEISTKGPAHTGPLKYKLLDFLQPWTVFNQDVFELHWSNYIQAVNRFHV